MNRLWSFVKYLEYLIQALSTRVASLFTKPATTFVFRPGGVAGGNVYTDPVLLAAAVAATQGACIVEVDNSIAPAVFPANLNFGHAAQWDVEIRGIPSGISANFGTSLTIQGPETGASIFRNLSIGYTGAVPGIVFAAGSVLVEFLGEGDLACTGGAAFVRCAGTSEIDVFLENEFSIIGGATALEANGNASTLLIVAEAGSFVGVNTIGVSGGATNANLELISKSPAALIANGQAAMPGGVIGSSLVLVSNAVNIVATDAAPAFGTTIVQGQLTEIKRCLASFSAQNAAQVDAPPATPTVLATLPAINVNANESVVLTASAWWLDLGGVSAVQVFEWLEDGVVVFEFESRDNGNVGPGQESTSYTFVRKPAAGNHTYALRTTSGAGQTSRFLFPPGTPSPSVNIRAQRLLG